MLTAMLAALPLAASSAQEPPARLFAAHALALRAAGVAGEDSASRILADAPGLGADGAAPVLWAPFFENAVVKLSRLNSSRPVALYYNPLLDAALFTSWKERDGGFRVASARALPGERLSARDTEAPPRPPWMASPENPALALAAVTASRLAAFERAYPEGGDGAGRVTFAAAAADMRAALPRLAWNAIQRARWAAGTPSWLAPTLARIEETLAARDAAAIRAAAPETDGTTAAALAGLPIGFVEGLALDMVLDAGGGKSLLIGSLPEDGDMYVFVLCGREGDTCALRRFMLASLLE